jgi:hypothetical protein
MRPQAPQLLGSPWTGRSQPVVTSPSQLPKPGAHAVMTQAPLRQAVVAFGRVGHVTPRQGSGGGGGVQAAPQHWVAGMQRPLHFWGRDRGQTHLPLRQTRPVVLGLQLALVQQFRLGMHRRPQCFLPAGQCRASASPSPSRPATEPRNAPPSVRREREDAKRRANRSKEESMATSGDSAAASTRLSRAANYDANVAVMRPPRQGSADGNPVRCTSERSDRF